MNVRYKTIMELDFYYKFIFLTGQGDIIHFRSHSPILSPTTFIKATNLLLPYLSSSKKYRKSNLHNVKLSINSTTILQYALRSYRVIFLLLFLSHHLKLPFQSNDPPFDGLLISQGQH